MHPDRPEPIQVLFAHLDREEAALRHCRDALTRLHAGLKRGEASTTRSDVSKFAQVVIHLATERAKLIPLVATDCHSLSDLLRRLPAETAGRLGAQQRALAELSRVVLRLHDRCTQFLAYSRLFLTRFLREVRPGSPAGPRYSPAGLPRG